MSGFSPTNNALVTYIKESKDELKKVAWPSREVIIRDTIVVLGLSAAVAIFFGALDFGLSYGLQKIIGQ